MEGISQAASPGPACARYPAAVSHTVILSSARTPFGRLGGALASRTAVQLGVVAASAALQRAEVEPGDIDYAVIGQVVQAGAGHIPSRQVTLGIGRARGRSAPTRSTRSAPRACAPSRWPT